MTQGGPGRDPGPVVTADLAEPQYGPRSKARVHRRLSMPTAGYDGC
ncbi:hypothetical protein [Streptomyces sp. NPDC060188]